MVRTRKVLCYVLCLVAISTGCSYDSWAQSAKYFSGNVERLALKEFFGDQNSSYFVENRPLWYQAEIGLGTDFLNQSTPIERKPEVLNHDYFYSGVVDRPRYVVFSYGASVILRSDASIVAAGFLSNFDCYRENGQKRPLGSMNCLTIFLSSRNEAQSIKRIFVEWANHADIVNIHNGKVVHSTGTYVGIRTVIVNRVAPK